jgi:hypothetical protein
MGMYEYEQRDGISVGYGLGGWFLEFGGMVSARRIFPKKLIFLFSCFVVSTTLLSVLLGGGADRLI